MQVNEAVIFSLLIASSQVIDASDICCRLLRMDNPVKEEQS